MMTLKDKKLWLEKHGFLTFEMHRDVIHGLYGVTWKATGSSYIWSRSGDTYYDIIDAMYLGIRDELYYRINDENDIFQDLRLV